jgi:predicted dehydrogenase
MSSQNNREPVRVAIIGAGQRGKIHLEAYQKVPDAQIVALVDVNEPEARLVAQKYGIPDVYTDFRAVLERDDIDAVDVILHNNLHRPMTVAALEAGKHVYCEKPMAGTYADAEAMMDAAQAAGKHLGIQLSFLFSDATKAARYLIDEGELGRVYHARSVGHRRRGRPYVDGYGTPAFVQKAQATGGALIDMGVYHISQILYLLDNPEVTRVSGKIYQETDMDSARRENSGYDVEELGMGFVRFTNDATLDILEAWAVHMDKFESSMLFGSQGGIRLDPFGFFRSVGHLDMDSTADMGGFRWRLHMVGVDGDAYDSPQAHWIAALQGRVPLLPTAEIALNTMLISEGIYLSDQLGREVTPEEIRQHSKSTAIKI